MPTEALYALRLERDKLKEATKQIEHSIRIIETLYGAAVEDEVMATTPPVPAVAPVAKERSAAPPKAETKKTREHSTRRRVAGEYTYDEVMELTGLGRKAVANKRQVGAFKAASYGHLTATSVDAWLEQRDGNPIEVVAPKKEAALAPMAEAFVQEDKLAKELKMDLAHLRMVKAEGGIAGGFGWIDRAALSTYMQSSHYTAP